MIMKHTTTLFYRHVFRNLSRLHHGTVSPTSGSSSACRKCNISSFFPVYSKNSRVLQYSLRTQTQTYLPTSFPASRSYATNDNNPDKPVGPTKESPQKEDPLEPNKETEEKLSLYQRFKLAYKKHGYVLIGVHVFTSIFWAGGFYYTVTSGVDVIALLEYLHFSENTLDKMRHSSLGNVALAYLLYKLATPARYTVTLTGTRYAIKYFQRQGKIPKPSERERLKDLVKDGRKEFKTKVKDGRDELKAKVKEERQELKVKMKKEKDELKAKVKDTLK